MSEPKVRQFSATMQQGSISDMRFTRQTFRVKLEQLLRIKRRYCSLGGCKIINLIIKLVPELVEHKQVNIQQCRNYRIKSTVRAFDESTTVRLQIT